MRDLNRFNIENEDLKRLTDQFLDNNFIDPLISEQLGVKRGLRNPDGTGVLAGLTNVCDVVGYKKDDKNNIIPIDGKLFYRGYSLNDLVLEAINNDRFMFEEVIWLLLLGSLPTKDDLAWFNELLDEYRKLPDGFIEKIMMSIPSPNIMNLISRSVLTLYTYDDKAEDTSLENIISQSINLIASLPTMVIYAYETKRHVYDHKSMHYHYPKKGLSTAEHLLATYRPDQKYTLEEAKLLDLCLVVHADHGGGNCSTFSNRVLSSALSDTYAAISAAIGALKGPRHGGANLMVMHQLDDIFDNVSDPTNEEQLKAYLHKIVKGEANDRSGLIYGIGHAVYTISDPRCQILKEQSYNLAIKKGYQKQWQVLSLIEKLAPIVLKEEKNQTTKVCANVDLFSGLIYRMLGFKEELFTPIFAVSRIPGWCVHRMEEVKFANRIMRPAYKYLGDTKEYISLKDR